MSNVSTWSQTAASNNSSAPNGWPEGMSPASVNDSARENMAAIAKWYAALKGGLTSGGSANTYTLTTGSSHASLAAVGLVVFRASFSNTGTCTLNVDGLGAKTIKWNGQALGTGAIVQDMLFAMVYNPTGDNFDLVSAPMNIPALKVNGLTLPTTDGSSGQAMTTNGAGTLSFSTISANITYSTRTSNTILAAGDRATLVDVTSGTFTQTLTAAATLGNGWYCFYRNSGTGTITLDPNASETIGGASTRTVRQRECILIQCDGSNFNVMEISPAAGLAFIETKTASNSATIDFTGLSDTYDEYIVEGINVVPATDGANLWLRTSTNGGSSYDSGASDYNSVSMDNASPVLSTGAAQIEMSSNTTIGSDTNETGYSFSLKIVAPSAAAYKSVYWSGMLVSTAGLPRVQSGSGQRLAAADVDAIRFLMSSGNIESGTFNLYGYRRA